MTRVGGEWDDAPRRAARPTCGRARPARLTRAPFGTACAPRAHSAAANLAAMARTGFISTTGVAKRPRSDWDRAIGAIAARQHGVVTHAQLVALGMGLSEHDPRPRLRRTGSTGSTTGSSRSGYLPLVAHGYWAAAVLACGPGPSLSYASSAERSHEIRTVIRNAHRCHYAGPGGTPARRICGSIPRQRSSAKRPHRGTPVFPAPRSARTICRSRRRAPPGRDRIHGPPRAGEAKGLRFGRRSRRSSAARHRGAGARARCAAHPLDLRSQRGRGSKRPRAPHAADLQRTQRLATARGRPLDRPPGRRRRMRWTSAGPISGWSWRSIAAVFHDTDRGFENDRAPRPAPHARRLAGGPLHRARSIERPDDGRAPASAHSSGVQHRSANLARPITRPRPSAGPANRAGPEDRRR